MPKCHVNYEDRLCDWIDNLPKFLGLDTKSGEVDSCCKPLGKGLGKLCIKYFDLPGRKEPLMFLVNYAKIQHDFVAVE